jgi:hypothetical protein
MGHNMSYDHSWVEMIYLILFYCFVIIFECNNVVILCLVISM